MQNHLISLMLLLPVVGAFFQAVTRSGRWLALGFSLASSLCGIALVVGMHGQMPELQFVETLDWIGSYNIRYFVGVDGMSALLVLLVSILFPVLIAVEWNQKAGVRGFHGLLLLLQFASIGVVCSQDLFLMGLFWTLSAIPIYFLVGIWGGKNKEAAAVRFIVTSVISNALFFAAIILIYYSVDPHTFSISELSGGILESKTFLFAGQERNVGWTAFSLLGFGICLRAPIWPIHGWFTRIAEDARPSVFVAVASLLVPISIYVFSRLAYSLFPDIFEATAPFIVVLGVINLVMGALSAYAQKGYPLLVAYLALFEVGLVLVGLGSLTKEGVVGALYQVFALGIGLAGLSLLFGIIEERVNSREFLGKDRQKLLGGVSTRAPQVAVVGGVMLATVLGIPGFSGFVGHSLLMIGGYSGYPWAVVVAALMLLVVSYGLFSAYRDTFFGEGSALTEKFSDLVPRERAYLLPVFLATLVVGVYPGPLVELIRPTLLTLLSTVK